MREHDLHGTRPPDRSGSAHGNGVRIHFEVFGPAGPSTVLLVAGMDTPCTLWFPAFYEPLVEAGHRVVRYGHRDCGLSEWLEDGDPRLPYSLDDMGADAVGLLDALGVRRAHWVGASMGGMIAQQVAIRDPARVQTLTCIASSGDPFDPHAAPASNGDPESMLRLQTELSTRFPRYGSDPRQTVEVRVEVLRCLAGSRYPFDASLHRRAERWNVLERGGFHPRAQARHLAAVVASGSRLAALGRVRIPTLVLHGTEDPMLPPAHGRRCAASIPGARCVWMDGVGHELPEGILGLVHAELLAHLQRSEGIPRRAHRMSRGDRP